MILGFYLEKMMAADNVGSSRDIPNVDLFKGIHISVVRF